MPDMLCFRHPASLNNNLVDVYGYLTNSLSVLIGYPAELQLWNKQGLVWLIDLKRGIYCEKWGQVLYFDIYNEKWGQVL